MLTEGAFDPRTLVNMQVALERICETVADGESHEVRKRIAEQIVRCARGGRITLDELTAAGERGLLIMNDQVAS
jgi:hypothetical protein